MDRDREVRKKRGGIQKDNRPRTDKGSKRRIFMRTTFLMVTCGVLIYIPLLLRLWDLAVLHHDEYGQLAGNQQTKNISVSANRGEILDTNGDVLAMSATVYRLILSPLDVMARVSKNADSDGAYDEAAYSKAVEERRMTLALGISEILPELTFEGIMERMEKTHSQYEILLNGIEEDQAEELRVFMTEQKCGYDLWLTPDSKRYYPYGQLGAGIIGFVNANGGATGVEAAMESELKGIEGRVVTAQTGRGVEMYNSFSSFEDASDGNTVQLTLDATIQSYAERALAEGIQT
ncbi:MAG: penicillin-binding protein, partial [Eubacteriales bacterium]